MERACEADGYPFEQGDDAWSAAGPLIDHALERFRAVGVRRVTIIINEESDDCRRWLERTRRES